MGKKSKFLILDENNTYQSLFLFLFLFVSFHTSSSQLDFFMILRRNYLVDVNKGNCTTVAYFPKTLIYRVYFFRGLPLRLIIATCNLDRQRCCFHLQRPCMTGRFLISQMKANFIGNYCTSTKKSLIHYEEVGMQFYRYVTVYVPNYWWHRWGLLYLSVESGRSVKCFQRKEV